MKKGIFLTLLFCGVAVADMSRSGEIVTDSKTKLMWQDNEVEPMRLRKLWQGAIDYCEVLTLGGYSDWRLPNIREFKSIIDRRYKPAINPAFVNKKTSTDTYWSSTSFLGDTNRAWTASFNEGSLYHYTKDYYNNFYDIRCVRGGR